MALAEIVGRRRQRHAHRRAPEIGKKPFERGSVGVAYRAGRRRRRMPTARSSSAWRRVRTLNGKYTMIGKVTKGIEVAAKIELADILKRDVCQRRDTQVAARRSPRARFSRLRWRRRSRSARPSRPRRPPRRPRRPSSCARRRRARSRSSSFQADAPKSVDAHPRAGEAELLSRPALPSRGDAVARAVRRSADARHVARTLLGHRRQRHADRRREISKKHSHVRGAVGLAHSGESAARRQPVLHHEDRRARRSTASTRSSARSSTGMAVVDKIGRGRVRTRRSSDRRHQTRHKRQAAEVSHDARAAPDSARPSRARIVARAASCRRARARSTAAFATAFAEK